jgi:hypothetical protein
MITLNDNRALGTQPHSTNKRVRTRFFLALSLLMTFPGCQWMYTDTGEPTATKDKFLWNDTKPKSNRNTFNMSGLSDESQAIERNLGGK